jgi:SAM-dependent methyltransferase
MSREARGGRRPPTTQIETNPDDNPIVSIGASVDVEALVAQIKAEVARKAEEGVYPPELMIELVASTDRLASAVEAVRNSAYMQFDPPSSSRRPVLGKALGVAKFSIQRVLRFQTNWVAAQVNTFSSNVAQATGALAERLQEVEERSERASAEASSRLDRLERRVRHAEQLTTPGSEDDRNPGSQSLEAEFGLDYRSFEDQFRGSEEEIGRRQAEYVPLFGGRTEPIVDIGCGRGEFLQRLRESGSDAYGIDRNPAMIARCRELGLDAREGDALEHLGSAAPRSLGGIFAAQVLEHFAARDVIAFVELAARALAPGGVLVVETLNPQSLSTFTGPLYVDLGHVRPLHPLTLRFLAERGGFREVEVRFLSPIPDEQRLSLLPAEMDETSSDRDDTRLLNENFRRIDAALFGPVDFALIGKK